VAFLSPKEQTSVGEGTPTFLKEGARGAMSASVSRKHVGSGAVVALGLAGFAMILLSFSQIFGWDVTWRAFGVTPLQPPFFDMYVINEYAACAAKGADPYIPRSCSGVNFNIPPTWLWLGRLGVEVSDTAWMSAVMIGAAATVMVLLFSGRPWLSGVVALAALVSPSAMMGVERANLDVLILAIVGTSALIYDERSVTRSLTALARSRVEVDSAILCVSCRTL
jgi:hypothetical protein